MSTEKEEAVRLSGSIASCFIRQKRSYPKANWGTVNCPCEWMCGHNAHTATMHLCRGSSKFVNENAKNPPTLSYISPSMWKNMQLSFPFQRSTQGLCSCVHLVCLLFSGAGQGALVCVLPAERHTTFPLVHGLSTSEITALSFKYCWQRSPLEWD